MDNNVACFGDTDVNSFLLISLEDFNEKVQ